MKKHTYSDLQTLLFLLRSVHLQTSKRTTWWSSLFYFSSYFATDGKHITVVGATVLYSQTWFFIINKHVSWSFALKWEYSISFFSIFRRCTIWTRHIYHFSQWMYFFFTVDALSFIRLSNVNQTWINFPINHSFHFALTFLENTKSYFSSLNITSFLMADQRPLRETNAPHKAFLKLIM